MEPVFFNDFIQACWETPRRESRILIRKAVERFVFGRAQLHDPYVSRKDMFLLESDLLDRGEEGKGKERENCFKELGNLWPQITATK